MGLAKPLFRVRRATEFSRAMYELLMTRSGRNSFGISTVRLLTWQSGEPTGRFFSLSARSWRAEVCAVAADANVARKTMAKKARLAIRELCLLRDIYLRIYDNTGSRERNQRQQNRGETPRQRAGLQGLKRQSKRRVMSQLQLRPSQMRYVSPE